jgi:pyrimidine-nucleoside phosphorylase
MITNNPVSLIRKKRDGDALSSDEIRWLIHEYTHDRIPDYQMASFLMAGYLNGLNAEEASALCDAMLHSGIVLDLSDIPGIKVDKHSTGGVGDKLSLILAPIVAACGVPVPMISGRGLGHSGGTLDKLESIPGFNVNLDLDRYREVLRAHNLVLIGQTEDIAPADKRMYALRDVTATVECIPFIAASIMSKKLAEGIDALVLDVKFGSGAFMKTEERALDLARTLVSIGEAAGKRTVAYLTNMDQPLGRAIGNWNEVRESIEVLQGGGPHDVRDLSLLLAGTMIHLGGKASSVEAGIAMGKARIADGSAFRCFVDVARAQDADVATLLAPDTYPTADVSMDVLAAQDGIVVGFDSYEIGMAGVELGAGRLKKEDSIDPTAGIELHVKLGSHVVAGDRLATLFTSLSKSASVRRISERIPRAIHLGNTAVKPVKQVTHVVNRDGVSLY